MNENVTSTERNHSLSNLGGAISELYKSAMLDSKVQLVQIKELEFCVRL